MMSLLPKRPHNQLLKFKVANTITITYKQNKLQNNKLLE